MSSKTGPENKADRLIDMLIEETLSMSDEEILADVSADSDETDHALLAEIDGAIAAHRRRRLEAARAAVVTHKRMPRLVRQANGDLRGAIARAVANNDAAFTLAARDGRGVPDEDLAGLADDLRDLGFNLGEEDDPDAC